MAEICLMALTLRNSYGTLSPRTCRCPSFKPHSYTWFSAIEQAKEAKRRFDRELELRQQFESRVNSEKARKAEAENLIANFEAEEARLIERLKATQVEQHGELTKLEKTLLSP